MFLPIEPEWAIAILRREKKWEIRKRRPSLERGDLVVLYATTPLRAVVGTFLAGEILSGRPTQIWREIRLEMPGTLDGYLGYLGNAPVAHAIRVTSPRRVTPFEPPFTVGQGWRFLDPRDPDGRFIARRVRR
jgi:predicted transcriptional regulator